MPLFASYRDFIRLEAKVDEALRHIHTLLERTHSMSAALDRITADVTALHDNVEKLIASNADIAAQLKALAANQPADDSDALNALADQIEATNTDVSNALNPPAT